MTPFHQSQLIRSPFSLVLIAIALISMACQTTVPAASPATAPALAAPEVAAPDLTSPEPPPNNTSLESAQDPPVSLGQELFIAKGCAACHGQNGEGTPAAPALPGHNESQVRRQARAPVGIMPVFPPDKISEEELVAIVDFVESLEGGHGHSRSGTLGDELLMHHWMALFAVEDNSMGEAIHHVEHIVGLTEGQHKAKMNETLSLLDQGDEHGAAHILETMLAGLTDDVAEETDMHLRLALSSTRLDDDTGAAHHMEHAIDSTEHSSSAAVHGEIAASIVAGNLTDAEHLLVSLLGDAAVEDDHGSDDSEAHEADAHEEGDTHEVTEAHEDGAEHGAAEVHEEGDAHDAAEAHEDGAEHGAAEVHEEGDEHEAEAHADDHDAAEALEEGADHDAADAHEDDHPHEGVTEAHEDGEEHDATEAHEEVDEHHEAEGNAEGVDAELPPLEEALDSLRNGDIESAVQEIEHFIESASDTIRTEAEEVLDLIRSGKLHGAQDTLAEMLGQEGHSD